MKYNESGFSSIVIDSLAPSAAQFLYHRRITCFQDNGVQLITLNLKNTLIHC